MCGRYASFRDAQDLADAFAVSPEEIAEDARELPPSWNVAPTDPVRVVVERERDGTPRRSLRVARWGLVPGWAKDPSIGSRMINARVETLATKPAFRRALVTRRCLVPAEGYFEWQRAPAGAHGGRASKQPFWIHPPDGAPVAFAGLFEFWRDASRPDDDPQRWLVTTTVVTGGTPTDDPVLGAIHDRSPVILDPTRWDAWLDPRTDDPEAALDLLRGRPPALVATPVSTEVNRVGTQGPRLIEPVPPPAPVPGD